MALGVLDDCSVAEVVLVPCLDAESPLCTHPSHCLTDIHCANVLQPRQTNVQCTEGTCTLKRDQTFMHSNSSKVVNIEDWLYNKTKNVTDTRDSRTQIQE